MAFAKEDLVQMDIILT